MQGEDRIICEITRARPITQDAGRAYSLADLSGLAEPRLVTFSAPRGAAQYRPARYLKRSTN
jgi:hypothetical protein